VRGATSSTDSSKSVWPVRSAWAVAAVWVRNFLLHSLQRREFAWGSAGASSEAVGGFVRDSLISEMSLSWLAESQSIAGSTVRS
jgi:hypothetical protein